MAKMKIAPKDRPKAKAELLRVLASHQLDPARMEVLGLFIDRYLTMTGEEMRRFERELAGFGPAERETTMEMMTSWELKGIEQGIEQGIARGLHDGKEDIVARLIRKRFGAVADDITARIDRLTSEQLSELSEALLDFTSLADLEQWLANNHSALA